MKNTVYVLLLFIFFVRCTTNTQVDLIVYNAKVYTVDSAFTTIEAFAVKNGIFIDMGKSKDILKRYSAKEIIDAQQKPVYPGFYDAHGHSFLLSKSIQEVDLTGTTSMDEVIKRLQIYHQKNPHIKWIVGSGWDQNHWDDKNLPTRDSLDAYFPHIPVFLTRIDHHAALTNAKAFEMAQIDSVQAIVGGLMVADSFGKPTGMLIDNAMNLIKKFIPSESEHDLLKNLRQTQDSLFSVGLTSIVDAGLTEEQADFLKNFYLKDSLKIRNYAMIYAEPKNVDRIIREGIYETDRLTIKSVKMMADGALGSHGACLLEEYSDAPTKGFLLNSPAEYEGAIQKLASSPFQVAFHAIGDSSNRMILDLYGKYLGSNNDRRWRIEHAQIVAPEDLFKFKKYQVIPSIQPTHATSDMHWAVDRIGIDRITNAYAFKDLLQNYGKVAIGSDFPVEPINPLYGFHAAVTRQDKNNLPKDGFQPDQRLTREQALRGMTNWAAYACFQENKRGSIKKGKDADFVILDEDIMTIAADKLRNVKVLRTVVAGETVYKK